MRVCGVGCVGLMLSLLMLPADAGATRYENSDSDVVGVESAFMRDLADSATKRDVTKEVIDGNNQNLHTNATVTKRDMHDIPKKIENVMNKVAEYLESDAVAKRGIFTQVATSLQSVIDGIDNVLHPGATVTKRNLVDIAGQIEGIVNEISKILGPSYVGKRGVITDVTTSLQQIIDAIQSDDSATKRDVADKATKRDVADSATKRDVADSTTKRDVADKVSKRDLADKATKNADAIFGAISRALSPSVTKDAVSLQKVIDGIDSLFE